MTIFFAAKSCYGKGHKNEINAYKEKYTGIMQFYSRPTGMTLKIPPSMLGDDSILRLAICSKAVILCRVVEKNGQTIEKYSHFGICRCSFLENFI